MTGDRANTPGPHWDLDQLADYAAGLLSDADAAAVEAVLAGDPAAAQLYSGLVHADDLVRAELRELPSVAMPADIAARLDAALAAEAELAAAGVGALAGAKTAETAGAEAADELAGARATRGTVAGNDGPGRAPSQDTVVPLRRRRWLTGAGAVAASVAVLAAGAFGVSQLLGTQRTSSNTTPADTLAGAPRATQMPAKPDRGQKAGTLAEQDKPSVRLVTSGTNYRDATLERQVKGARTLLPPRSAAQVPAGLAEVGRDGARACLAQLGIDPDNPGMSVDLATYEGEAAVVVTVRTAAGVTVVVAGPECGTDGADLKLRRTFPGS